MGIYNFEVYDEMIQKLQEVAIRLNVVSVYDVPAYTVHELLYLVMNKFNELATETNRFEKDTIKLLKQMAEELDSLLRGDKVSDEINKTLIEWKENGTFDHLIQHSVFKNFEERLEGIEGEIPALKQEVNQKVDEAIQQIENFNLPQFDNYPMFFKSFFGVRTSVIQDFRKVDENRWLVSQAGGATALDNGESFTLTLINTNGELLSSMELIHGGHGSMFNCQLQADGSIDIYFTCDATVGNKIVKTKYVAGGKLDCSRSDLATIKKTSEECQLVYINFAEDKILFATTSGSGRWYKAEVFNFLDYINGRQTAPSYVSNHTKIGNITSQGFAISENTMFVYAGSLGLNDVTLRIVDLPTNTYKDVELPNLGKLAEDHQTEAEGIYIDENKNVYIGVATGTGGTTRNFNAYVYAHKTDQQHILGKVMETAQMYKMTDANGYAMGLSPLPARISDIVRPGWYYFTTNEMKQFADVPEEYAGGSWLHVLPRTKDGGTYQELIRHTSGNNRWRLGRSINSTGEIYDWKHLTTQYKTLYANNDRTVTSFVLSEPISNFDMIQIRTWGAGGRYNTKTLTTSLLVADKTFVIHDVNLGDSDTSTGLYVQEFRLSIDNDLKTFTYLAKSQVGWTGTTFARTNDVTNGIVEVIGIRG